MRLTFSPLAFLCLAFTALWTGCTKVSTPPPSVSLDPAIETVPEAVELEAEPEVSKPERPFRAMWVWKSLEIIESPEKMERLFDFCAQPPAEAPLIKRLYFYATSGLLRSESGQKKLATFIQSAHARGIEVHLLGGSPEMSYQKIAGFNLIKNLNVYNTAVEPASRFDGLHLDIEPHTLGVIWEQDDRLRNRFIETIPMYYKKFNEIRNGMSLGLDIALGYTSDLKLLTTLIDNSDYVTIMDYRDRAESIIDGANPVMKIALERGKRVEIGIETQKPNQRYGVTPLITFWDEGAKKMEAELRKVEEYFRDDGSFSGIVVHDYNGYRLLPKEKNVVVDTRTYPVLPTIIAPYTRDPILINGDKSKWKNPPDVVMKGLRGIVFGKSTWISEKDLGGNAWIAWDAKNFYIAVDVTDNQLVQPFEEKDMVNGDHVELWLDLDYEKNKDLGVASEGVYQLGLSPGNFADNPPGFHYWIPGGLSKSKRAEVEISAVKTKVGYFIEALIPWSILGDFEPSDEKPFRINIDLSDTDNMSNPSQESLMSTSPHRKFGNPKTFRYAEFRTQSSRYAKSRKDAHSTH